jgi:transposase
MMLLPTDVNVYLCLEPTDMRKSIDTLSVLVKEDLSLEPSSGHLFLFCNRARNKLKALYYERNSFTLWYRRLERGKYIFPKDGSGHIEITQEHFEWLLASNKYSRIDNLAETFYENYL